jgi:pimeloyl-ACP methyl ester carboxylesterase
MNSSFTPAHRGGSGAPLVCLHGLTDTWRTWELILPALEREHDVLAVTLAGHAGGPPVDGELSHETFAGAVEQAMDDAGFATAHILGNSLGGYVALQLALRGRAETVVALAPAGGWAPGDESYKDTLAHFTALREPLKLIAPNAEAILATAEGPRRATQDTTTNFEHIPLELLAHQIRGAAGCDCVEQLVALALRDGWSIDAREVACPLRIVWGSEDRILPLPASAARFRAEQLPQADWIELDGIGHLPQLDVPPETAQLVLGFIAG